MGAGRARHRQDRRGPAWEAGATGTSRRPQNPEEKGTEPDSACRKPGEARQGVDGNGEAREAGAIARSRRPQNPDQKGTEHGRAWIG